jgi:hypothetical protein
VFGKFLGVGEKKLRKEILNSYLILLKRLYIIYLDIPISFHKLFNDPLYMSFTINIDTGLEILEENFSNFELTKDILIQLMGCVHVYETDRILNDIKVEHKCELFMLTRFYNKSSIFISNLLNQYKNGEHIKIHINCFYEHFYKSNKDILVNEEMMYRIFHKYLSVNLEKDVDLENFFEFFSVNQFNFKIKVIEFIEITFQNLTGLFAFLDKKFSFIFDQFNTKKDGLMSIKEFQNSLISMISEREWNLLSFFKYQLYIK